MTRRYVYIIAAVLAGISIATFFYNWQVLGFPVSGDQEQPVWTIETSIRFDAGPGSIKANLQIPTLLHEQGPAGRNFRRCGKPRCRWARRTEQEASGILGYNRPDYELLHQVAADFARSGAFAD
jgi:hypothetical protein